MCPIKQCGVCEKLIPPNVLRQEPKATFCSIDCTEDYLSMTEEPGAHDSDIVF